MELGFSIKNLEFSPIKGPEGNIEYLIYMKKDEEGSMAETVTIQNTVEEAHAALDKKS